MPHGPDHTGSKGRHPRTPKSRAESSPEQYTSLHRPDQHLALVLSIKPPYLLSMVAPVNQLDRLFQALADPTRRAVLERLARGPASVTELASPFPMALPSFVRHVGVLEEAELVRTKKEGRVRTVWLVPERVEAVEHWLSRQRRLWERRLDQLDRYALTLKKEMEK